LGGSGHDSRGVGGAGPFGLFDVNGIVGKPVELPNLLQLHDFEGTHLIKPFKDTSGFAGTEVELEMVVTRIKAEGWEVALDLVNAL
jgi:hypothetical protein